jgi:hypothetical protein
MLPISLTARLVSLTMRQMNRRWHTRQPPILRPKTTLPLEQRQAFERLWKQSQLQGKNPLINYILPYPKMDFLNYLCDFGENLVSGGIVAHGSGDGGHALLQPIRKSTDAGEFGNRQQVFSTPDAIYAAWFAILDKSRYRTTRNACLRVGPLEGSWIKVYFFHLRRESAADPPYTPGYIYLCRAVDFPSRRDEPFFRFLGVEAEEWGSAQPVQPLARIALDPTDFPYLPQVEFVL